jgi:tetratricopeptide (TPR) repeat protein
LVLIGLAEIYAQQPDRKDAAMKLARQARDSAPLNPRVAHLLGRLAFQAGDHAWALSLLEESAGQSQSDGAVDYDLAWALYSQGRITSSLQVMSRAADSGSPSLDIDAAKQFLRLVQRPDDPSAQDELIKLADSILDTDPDYVPAIMVRGAWQEKTGEYTLAAKSYDRVLEVFPDFVPAMKRLTVVYADHLNRDVEAYEFGMRARAVLGNDAELALALGKVVYRRGEMNYARSLLQQAMGHYPKDAEFLYYLGLIEFQSGSGEVGRRYLTQAMELNPNHRLAAEARAILASN